MQKWLIVVLVILGLLLAGFLIWYFFIRKGRNDGYFRLPLHLLGLHDIPAVPFSIPQTLEATVKLLLRSKQTEQALNGLQNVYTIEGQTANGRAFLYGLGQQKEDEDAKESVKKELKEALNKDFQRKDKLLDRISKPSPLPVLQAVPPINQLNLEKPSEFAMGWTVFADVYRKGAPLLPGYAATLEVSDAGVEAATKAFFKSISHEGLAFNLLLPKKVGELEYDIDLGIFKSLEAFPESGQDAWRFTPAVVVHLRQDPLSKELLPFSIEVSDYQGAHSRTYIKDDSGTSNAGWMYALQAAKTAVTVWGIWLGHVYHWHIVTAAMQMTMFQNLDASHPVRTFLDPVSKYLIGFDGFLLLTFKHAAPPTSLQNGLQWMSLENTFAAGRSYHDDDPRETLLRLGIEEADFTTAGGKAWDQYPIVAYMLELWDACEVFVGTYVKAKWPTGRAVVDDRDLKKWITAAGKPRDGNVKGLPKFKNEDTAQAELISLLTSYLYRVTAHGCSRMDTAANPALSFVGNYPPTMQIKDLPEPDADFDTGELLRYLPQTGTIGSMITFLFTFVFSPPYESLIPPTGITEDLYLGDGLADPLNQALLAYRRRVEAVIDTYAAGAPTYSQWPRNIET